MKVPTFDKSLIADLAKMMDHHNVLAQSFRRNKDLLYINVHSDFGLKLFRHHCIKPRVYNTPTSDEITTLIVGDLSNMDVGRDFLVKKIFGQLT